MNLAPIILFVYNRPWHTQQAIDALKKNSLASNSELFIFSDGAKNGQHIARVNEVRRYIRTIDGFAKITIIERKKKLGLAASVILGVTEVVNKYGRIIVLEDDLITAPYFLQFMNDALNFYKDEPSVGCIHGYVYPLKKNFDENFFLKDSGCWGWATWDSAWALFQPNGSILLDELLRRRLTKKFDFDGTYPFTQMLRDQIAQKNNSWAIRWQASLFLKDKLTLYPPCSLVMNWGFDSFGSHCGVSSDFDVELCEHAVPIKQIPLKENSIAFNAHKDFFKKLKGKNSLRVVYKFKWCLKKVLPYGIWNVLKIIKKCFIGRA